jgi:hypothetical protein
MKLSTLLFVAAGLFAAYYVYKKYIQPTEKTLNGVNAVGGLLSNIIPSQFLSPIAKAPNVISFY